MAGEGGPRSRADAAAAAGRYHPGEGRPPDPVVVVVGGGGEAGGY